MGNALQLPTPLPLNYTSSNWQNRLSCSNYYVNQQVAYVSFLVGSLSLCGH